MKTEEFTVLLGTIEDEPDLPRKGYVYGRAFYRDKWKIIDWQDIEELVINGLKQHNLEYKVVIGQVKISKRRFRGRYKHEITFYYSQKYDFEPNERFRECVKQAANNGAIAIRLYDWEVREARLQMLIALNEALDKTLAGMLRAEEKEQ